MEQPKNYAFHSIAVAWALNLIPHTYFFLKAKAAAGPQYSNILVRQNLANLKGKIPEATWNKLARARGAHLNALEGFPLFAAAMIAGTHAGVPAREMNVLAAEYVGVRLLYNALCMTVRNETMSYLRTGVWCLSVALPLYGLMRGGSLIVRAGNQAKRW